MNEKYKDIAPNFDRLEVVEDSYINGVIGVCFETTLEHWDLESLPDDYIESTEKMMLAKHKDNPSVILQDFVEYMFDIAEKKGKIILQDSLFELYANGKKGDKKGVKKGENKSFDLILEDLEKLREHVNNLDENNYNNLVSLVREKWEKDSLYEISSANSYLDNLLETKQN